MAEIVGLPCREYNRAYVYSLPNPSNLHTTVPSTDIIAVRQSNAVVSKIGRDIVELYCLVITIIVIDFTLRLPFRKVWHTDR